jgi:hypothetical protein
MLKMLCILSTYTSQFKHLNPKLYCFCFVLFYYVISVVICTAVTSTLTCTMKKVFFCSNWFPRICIRIFAWRCIGTRGLKRDVVYLGWPTAPSYISPKAGERGVAGSQPMSTHAGVHRSLNKLWRSHSIFNLLFEPTAIFLDVFSWENKKITYLLRIDVDFE